MKKALSDVPGLLEVWRESGNDKWVALLRARSALADACDDAVNTAAREGRGLTAGEQRAVDAHLGQIREINGWLAEYKRQRIADLAAEACRQIIAGCLSSLSSSAIPKRQASRAGGFKQIWGSIR